MAKALHKSIPCFLAVYMLFCSLRLSAAIRTTEVSGSANSSEVCTAGLRSVWHTVSFRYLFRPFFEGTYRIRNRYSGKYLTGSPDGFLGTSSHHVTTNKMSDWKLKRVQEPGTYEFTLQNKKSGNYLAYRGGQIIKEKEPSEAGRWWMQLSADGRHHMIRSTAAANNVIVENRTSFVELTERPPRGEEDLDSLKSEWFFEAHLSWLRWPQGDEAAYKSQWNSASDIPMFAGTELTWKQMCDKHQFDCQAGYARQRMTYKNLGKISETHRRIVTETIVKGSCDTEWGLIQHAFISNAEVLEEMRAAAGEACTGHSLASISEHLKQTIFNDCFVGCSTSIQEYIEENDLPCQKPENVTGVFLGILAKGQCDDVPMHSAEKLAEWAMFEKCFTWHQPDPLFRPDWHDRLSLATADGNPVCSVPAAKESSRNARDIVQQGACPSGTSCQCPTGLVKDQKSIMDLKADQALFIDPGSSLLALINAQLNSAQKKVLQNVLLRGMSLQAAVLAVPTTFFLAKAGWSLGSWVIQGLAWRCTQTVACWPNWPEQRRTVFTHDEQSYDDKACRLPSETKAGGSQVWFLPPPGVKVVRTGWYRARRCLFAECDRNDMLGQKVGFGPSPTDRSNVYNCQPLPFEQMDDEQQQKYFEKLRETLPDEYNEEIPHSR